MPRELPLIAKDLNAKRYMTVHNSKFKLANHSWDEPLKNAEALRSQGFDVLMPTIGEAVEWKKAIVSPEQKTVEPVEN
jgi:L-ascorbate metabolism protein UlaG (beta-lactamase superfamily)